MAGTGRRIGGSSADRPERKRLWYLTLEVPIEGHAVHTHVFGVIRGLEIRGWHVRVWAPPNRGNRRAARRLWDALAVQCRIMMMMMGPARRPAVLYVRAHPASAPSVAWARLLRVPVVLELNGPSTSILSSWPGLRPLMWLVHLAGRFQVRLSSSVIGGNTELVRRAADQGASRCHVVPNGADTDLFAPTATTESRLPATYVSFFGALATWQGLEDLLEAVDSPLWPGDVSLVVVGDGALSGRVKTRARVDARVVFMGRLPQRQLPGIIARSLAATSLRTGPGVVPLKLVEAMACGVPVIATAIAGQSDIVDRARCGILVPEGDSAAIAKAVTVLLENRASAGEMGARGRAAALAEYSWDHAAALTDRILTDMIWRRPTTRDAPSPSGG